MDRPNLILMYKKAEYLPFHQRDFKKEISGVFRLLSHFHYVEATYIRHNDSFHIDRTHRRKMPTVKAIAKYWGVDQERCMRCGVWADCQRAHIVDRCYDGLDVVWNIGLLCHCCHSDQPSFDGSQSRQALIWFRLIGARSYKEWKLIP